MYFSNLDLDECASPDLNECDPNALCTNTEGSYVCRCIKGFEGDGRNCTGKSYFQNCLFLLVWAISLFLLIVLGVVPVCSPSCGPNASCQDDIGSPLCICNVGYQGDGYNCTGWYGMKYYDLLFHCGGVLPYLVKGTRKI